MKNQNQNSAIPASLLFTKINWSQKNQLEFSHKNSKFSRKFRWLTKIRIITKSIVHENMVPNISMVHKYFKCSHCNHIVSPHLVTNLSIVHKKYPQTFQFLTNISIVDKTFNCSQIYQSPTNISIPHKEFWHLCQLRTFEGKCSGVDPRGWVLKWMNTLFWPKSDLRVCMRSVCVLPWMLLFSEVRFQKLQKRHWEGGESG